MLRLIFKSETTKVDDLIDVVLIGLQNEDPGTEAYSEMLANLERLHAVKAKENPDRVTPDTIALIAGNLAGILIIIAYERTHVMMSKSLSQVIRLK